MEGKQKSKKGLKVFLTLVLMCIVLMCAVFAVGVISYFATSDEFDVNMIELNLSSTVYYTDSDGNAREYQQIAQSENRVWVDISDIPKYMQDAFVAIEDQRFYSHGGVDIPRTAKATVKYLFTGSKSFGGSTITQQLVKNITGDAAKSPTRKIREMFRAVQLERRLSKEQVLELYLNSIYLSNNCYGVQAAANKYFGVDVDELSLAQCASIAGITQYPSYYDPLQNPENNIEKQHVVLSKMLELEKISPEEYDAAIKEQLEFGKHSTASSGNIQSYFTDNLINEVLKDLQKEKGYTKEYAEQILFKGGLKIYSTVEPKVQSSIEKYYENTSNFPQNAPAGKDGQKPQSAMIILDTKDGAVRGIVGGMGKKSGNRILNRATQSYRQPGSTMKPIGVYAPAIEKNLISPSSIIEDKPVTYGGWSPKNYYSGYKGAVSIRTAVKQSMNTPAVQVLDEVGVNYSYTFLTKNLGITSLVDNEVRNDGKTYSDKNLSSLALGGLTDGIRPIELAAAYAPFANGGIYNKPYTYTSVVDADGNTILEHKDNPKVAMSDSTAYLVNSMLQSVMTESDGTGYGSSLTCGIPSGGKTGTTDNDNDLWFVGYTPYYVGVVWYGYDNPKGLSWRTYHPCKAAWKAVMNEANSVKPYKDFDIPSSVESATVCSSTGNLPSSVCPKRTEYFKKGSLPTKKCSGNHTGISSTIAPPSADDTEKPTETNKPDITLPPQEEPENPPVQPTSPPQQEQPPADDDKILLE